MELQDMPADEFARDMSRRQIVYRKPTAYWQNGLSIGNGDLGGAVFGGGAARDGVIGITLSKVDVWDERYDRMGHGYRKLSEIRRLIAENIGTEEGRKFLNSLEPYGVIAPYNWAVESYPYWHVPPTPKPCGMLRIDAGVAPEAFESRLSIHRGEVAFAMGSPSRGVEASTFIDAESNVLAVRVTRHGRFDKPLSVELARYQDPTMGVPEIGAEGKTFWHRYVFPDGFVYAVYGIVVGQVEQSTVEEGRWTDVQAENKFLGQGLMRNGEKVFEALERSARLSLAPGQSEATVFLAVATSKECTDPLRRARELAETAERRGWESIRSEHLAWWDRFWRRSSLKISDRLIEAAWYQSIYVLACQSRGSQPPPLVGPGYYLPFAAWNGAYITNYNIEMTYWPAFASNHLELTQPYLDLFHGKMDVMKAETREYYEIDGVRIPCITNGTCRELSYLPCRNWQHTSAWIAQIYWWYYEYTGDEAYLRRQAYPLMREIARFYRGYARKGEDGCYHIFPSTPPEQPPWFATDPAVDTIMIRVHLAATIEAAGRLKMDADLREEWCDLLEHLAPIPNNGEVFLDHRDAAPDSKLGHTAMLSSTWTAGLIGIDSPATQKEMAIRTYQGLAARASRKLEGYPYAIPTWNDDCCWPNMIGYAARLGLVDAATECLYDMGIFQHLKPNGLFTFDIAVTDRDRQVRWGMPDSGLAMAAVISEMLLQSYNGVIRVGPTVPLEWTVSFRRFLAVGAFEVDADIVRGAVRHLEVCSLNGNHCRVVSPWPDEAVKVLCNGEAHASTQGNGMIEFDTVAGCRYAIVPVGPLPALSVSLDESSDGPLSYCGPSYMGNIAEGERVTVYLGQPG